jgi:hypothetical protein
MAIASNRLINSLKLFFDVIVEFEFIGARQSATTRSILFLTLAELHVQQVEVELSGDKNPEQMRM